MSVSLAELMKLAVSSCTLLLVVVNTLKYWLFTVFLILVKASVRYTTSCWARWSSVVLTLLFGDGLDGSLGKTSSGSVGRTVLSPTFSKFLWSLVGPSLFLKLN